MVVTSWLILIIFAFCGTSVDVSWEKYYKPGIQLSKEQIGSVMDQLLPSSNFLVYGVGFDSELFSKGANRYGRTLFIENNKVWMEKIRTEFPELEIQYVDYETDMHDAFTMYFDNTTKLARVRTTKVW